MGKGGAGCVGGGGCLFRNEGPSGRELDPIALGCQGMLIGGRSDEERDTSPGLPACKTLAGGVGGAEFNMDEEDEACCGLGEVGLRIAVDVDGCDSCERLFEIIGLTSVMLDVRGS